ncbi:BgTH12-02324 [Blumeria graminis f. sp. triticale]|uniref:BgTH12-02324 n=1 Tax=Blumeria graminis f. sp. triticale TaxID=1689686 RepID=A0A9W4D539_BLUGR|nr:BgTH12-02324 [Blumeria graminis f. sp. triticale]
MPREPVPAISNAAHAVWLVMKIPAHDKYSLFISAALTNSLTFYAQLVYGKIMRIRSPNRGIVVTY